MRADALGGHAARLCRARLPNGKHNVTSSALRGTPVGTAGSVPISGNLHVRQYPLFALRTAENKMFGVLPKFD